MRRWYLTRLYRISLRNNLIPIHYLEELQHFVAALFVSLCLAFVSSRLIGQLICYLRATIGHMDDAASDEAIAFCQSLHHLVVGVSVYSEIGVFLFAPANNLSANAVRAAV